MRGQRVNICVSIRTDAIAQGDLNFTVNAFGDSALKTCLNRVGPNRSHPYGYDYWELSLAIVACSAWYAAVM
jgi:hypothetical protein